jgi:hypothetical protein
MKTLKKVKVKKDNNISRANNLSQNFKKSFSLETEKKMYFLPPLKKNLYKNSLNQQSSVLSKYIENFVSNFINATKSLKKINSKSNLKITSKRNSNISKEKKLILKNEIKEIKNNDSISNDIQEDTNKILCLSDRNEISNNFTRNPNNFGRKLLYITEIKNRKKELSPQSSFSESKESNSKITQNKMSQNINLIIPKGNENNIPKPIDIKQELSLLDLKKLEKYFRRKKSYQPNILTDWKEKAGIDIKNSRRNYISEFENDVE